jgi:hypothetical protein
MAVSGLSGSGSILGAEYRVFREAFFRRLRTYLPATEFPRADSSRPRYRGARGRECGAGYPEFRDESFPTLRSNLPPAKVKGGDQRSVTIACLDGGGWVGMPAAVDASVDSNGAFVSGDANGDGDAVISANVRTITLFPLTCRSAAQRRNRSSWR